MIHESVTTRRSLRSYEEDVEPLPRLSASSLSFLPLYLGIAAS
jgi:hypothetical protein